MKSVKLSEDNDHPFLRAEIVVCPIVDFFSLELRHRFLRIWITTPRLFSCHNWGKLCCSASCRIAELQNCRIAELQNCKKSFRKFDFYSTLIDIQLMGYHLKWKDFIPNSWINLLHPIDEVKLRECAIFRTVSCGSLSNLLRIKSSDWLPNGRLCEWSHDWKGPFLLYESVPLKSRILNLPLYRFVIGSLYHLDHQYVSSGGFQLVPGAQRGQPDDITLFLFYWKVNIENDFWPNSFRFAPGFHLIHLLNMINLPSEWCWGCNHRDVQFGREGLDFKSFSSPI
jgi:hypothetical protein